MSYDDISLAGSVESEAQAGTGGTGEPEEQGARAARAARAPDADGRRRAGCAPAASRRASCASRAVARSPARARDPRGQGRRAPHDHAARERDDAARLDRARRRRLGAGAAARHARRSASPSGPAQPWPPRGPGSARRRTGHARPRRYPGAGARARSRGRLRRRPPAPARPCCWRSCSPASCSCASPARSPGGSTTTRAERDQRRAHARHPRRRAWSTQYFSGELATLSCDRAGTAGASARRRRHAGVLQTRRAAPGRAVRRRPRLDRRAAASCRVSSGAVGRRARISSRSLLLQAA